MRRYLQIVNVIDFKLIVASLSQQYIVDEWSSFLFKCDFLNNWTDVHTVLVSNIFWDIFSVLPKVFSFISLNEWTTKYSKNYRTRVWWMENGSRNNELCSNIKCSILVWTFSMAYLGRKNTAIEMLLILCARWSQKRWNWTSRLPKWSSSNVMMFNL